MGLGPLRTLLEQRSSLFDSEASKVTINLDNGLNWCITTNVDVWIMVQVSMLKALANPMESILVGKFFTTGMETQCMCKSCKIFHTLVSMRHQRLTKDYLITLVILAIDFRFGLVRLFDVVIIIIVIITIIRILRGA